MLLRPNRGVYLVFLLGFGIAAAIMGNYILAAVELGITALLFGFVLIYNAKAQRDLQQFMQKCVAPAEAEEPFPTAMKRFLN